MHTLGLDELRAAHNTNTLGLQYTIAERDRRDALWRMLADRLNFRTARIVSRIMQTTMETPAERFADMFALTLSGFKRNGFFVEFGATDGLCASNTLMLEKRFGWKGVLAEPLPIWHQKLRASRSARIDTRCVSGKSGEHITLFSDPTNPGTSSVDQNHVYIGNPEGRFDVETVSLLDLLVEHKAPRFIDFASIDVEGHEMAVLRNFDFDRFRFGMVCVEQHPHVTPENDLRPLFKAAGYRELFPRDDAKPLPMQVAGADLFFVPSR